MRQAQPSKIPPATPLRIEATTTAVLVLDLTAGPHEPDATRAKLLAELGVFLERARSSGVPIIFTGTVRELGAPAEPVLKRRDGEPLLYPDGYDKFIGGDMQRLLEERKAKTLVVTGGATNFAVMYTATAAIRNYHYQVVIPIDGVYAADAYRHEYALYQLSILPGGVTPPQYTMLRTIDFF
jgi:nicotinamidase-related amidase